MKTYEEMARSALKRIDNYKTEQKKRRKAAVKIIIPSLCLCIIAVICAGIGKSVRFGTETPLARADYTNQNKDFISETAVSEQTGDNAPAAAESKAPNNIKESEAVKPGGKVNRSGGQKSIDSVDGSFYLWWKNKFEISGTLYYAMEQNPGKVFDIKAVYSPATANIKSFTYEGKTLSELAIDAENERLMPEKMRELLKYGDDLKYGTALYETGTPSGEKWDKKMYEDKVAYFGEELLGKYIVDGIFLGDDLEKDIAALPKMNITTPSGTSTETLYGETKARNKYAQAYNAYLETVIPHTMKRLSDSGIKCERPGYMNNGFCFKATPEELENIPIDNLEGWYFDLVLPESKGQSDDTV